jgi:hypothetical protein
MPLRELNAVALLLHATQETCLILLLTRATRIAHDPSHRPSDRFHAVIRLETVLSANPFKQDIIAVLLGFSQAVTARRRRRRSVLDELYTEISGAGSRCVKW